MKGAEIIFIPTAIGYLQHEDGSFEGSGERDAWETVQRGHAVANGCYLAAVNRVGFEPDPYADDGLQFWGASFLADPYGRIIAQASETEEENLIGEIDMEFLDEARDTLAQFFRDRRIDSYGDLTKVFID